MRRTFLIICLLIVSSTICQSQNLTADEVMKKAESVIKKQVYVTSNMSYNLFLDYDSKNVYEQYKGFFLKMGHSNYIKIKNTEFINFDHSKGIKINHDEKAIQILENNRADIEESPFELTNYLMVFANRTLTSNTTHYICELKPNKISQIMFSKVLIYIKKNDFAIDKQIFYYVEKMESKSKEGRSVYTVPRLEIIYSPRKKNINSDKVLVKKGNYFTENKTELKLVKKLVTYKLIKS